jgi:hypothetical protein
LPAYNESENIVPMLQTLHGLLTKRVSPRADRGG